MKQNDQITDAILEEVERQEKKHGTTVMNPLELDRYITLMELEIEDAHNADAFALKHNTLTHILRNAALAVMCLYQFGLPGKKEADSAATEPAGAEKATDSINHEPNPQPQ